MKHLFIVNPIAGKKPDPDGLIKRIEEIAIAKGDPFTTYVTKAPMDACECVKRAASEEEELRVYACGGDGTLNECVNGAAGFPHVSVTHYPTGTGNDFVRMFGQEDAARFRDLKLLMDGESLPLDLIDCNGRLALNICSVGIDARIGTSVHDYAGNPLVPNKLAYVVSLICNVAKGINQNLRITHGDTETGEYALVCVCNGRFYGGGFNPVPDAEPDDGVLDCLVVKKVSRFGFFKMVGRYAKGRYAELDKLITRYGGSRFTVESDSPMAINLDGELMHNSRVDFVIRPSAINFIFPRGSYFLYTHEERN